MSRIRQYERSHGESAGFHVIEVMELAPGILAVYELDGEYSIFFDCTQYIIGVLAIENIGPGITGFPSDVGLIEDVTAQNWDDIMRTAMVGLKATGGREIVWNFEPEKLDY